MMCYDTEPDGDYLEELRDRIIVLRALIELLSLTKDGKPGSVKGGTAV